MGRCRRGAGAHRANPRRWAGPAPAGAERARPPQDRDERSGAREGFAATAVALAAVDEPGVGAERDVVEEDPLADPPDVDSPLGAAERGQRGERIVAVEPDVAGEVVPRP